MKLDESMLTDGFSCMKSKSRRVPIPSPMSIRPRWNRFSPGGVGR